MATSQDNSLEELVKKGEIDLEDARSQRGNENWVPAQGAGVLPEEEWVKYKPESDKSTQENSEIRHGKVDYKGDDNN